MNLFHKMEECRLKYQARYASYLRKYTETGDMDAHGHAMECSYVLIEIFGLTDEEVRQLEKNQFAGLLDRDYE